MIVILVQVFAGFLLLRGYPLEAALTAACASILIAHKASPVVVPRIA